jgi:hypothetical protein
MRNKITEESNSDLYKPKDRRVTTLDSAVSETIYAYVLSVTLKESTYSHLLG